MTVRWSEFATIEPAMAEAGRKLLYQFDIGLGYLATIRADGAPRLHPFCPIITGEGLFGLIIPGPKLGDLRRDGRFSIHACNPVDRDDEFLVSGLARRAEDDAEAVRVAFLTAEGAVSTGDETCFEFLIDRALHAAYRPRKEGWAPPTYQSWRLDKR